MRKKVLARGLLGFPIGVFVSSAIMVMISLIRGEVTMYAPAFAEQVGSGVTALALQFVLSGLCGMGFALSSLVWENERWSLLKRSAIACAACAVSLLPVAYICHWMEHSAKGALIYLGIFAGTFACSWVSQYAVWRRQVRAINARIGKQRT